jgi:hypothetical protein
VSYEYNNYRDFPLRLSPFMQSLAMLLAQRLGITLNSFIAAAIREKMRDLSVAMEENWAENPAGE